MARGRNFKKGGRKKFSNPDEINADLKKAEEKRKWREQHPDSDSETSSEEEEKPQRGGRGARGKVAAVKEESSGSEVDFASGSDSDSSSEDEGAKPKGAAAMIDIENPNRAQKKVKKVTDLEKEPAKAAKPELSRREREEIEKQRAKVHYQKMHAAGKTEEARSDLARLALVRKQREDAAAKRAGEVKAKEDAAKAKQDATGRALGKKK